MENRPPLARRLTSRHFAASTSSHLVVGQHDANELAERFGTPLYVFDAAVARARLRSVLDAMGGRVSVLFALKANPNAALARVLRRGGAGVDVASAGEILVALRAGFSGDQMHFAGPGKHGDDLRLALEHGVTMNVESLAELRAISAAAVAADREARVALRVNPPAAHAGSRMRMSGGSAKFGVDTELLDPVARAASALPRIKLVGLHTYAGTQTFDHEGWLANARFLVETAHALEDELALELESLNFGGGFGVPLSEKDDDFDLAAAGAGLREIVEKDRPGRRHLVELGRFLVAVAGVYLTRVVYAKESAGKPYVIVDGGMNQHAAAAGLGSVIRRPFPMLKANGLDEPAAEVPLSIGGPLCTPADAFPTSPEMPSLAPGDLVAFLASGAYGLTFSNTLFLGHPTPAEVLVDGERADVVRARGDLEDVLRGQHLPGDEG